MSINLDQSSVENADGKMGTGFVSLYKTCLLYTSTLSEKVADFAISLSRTLSICVVTVIAVNVSVEIPFVTSSPLSTIKPPSNLIRNCVSSGAVLDRYESFKASIASLNPVSYTHLDVYKRQILHFQIFCLIFI